MDEKTFKKKLGQDLGCITLGSMVIGVGALEIGKFIFRTIKMTFKGIE